MFLIQPVKINFQVQIKPLFSYPQRALNPLDLQRASNYTQHILNSKM